MKILQVCYKLPYPPNDGGAYSLYNTALGLTRQKSVTVKVLAMRLLKNKDNPELIPASFIASTQFEYVDVDNRIKPINAIKHFLRAENYFSQRFYSLLFESRLLDVIGTQHFDIIQLEHSYLCVYLDAIRRIYSGKIILRTQNVEHLLWESYIDVKRLNFFTRTYLRINIRQLKAFEQRALRRIDGLICLSEKDREIFNTLEPLLPTAVIPVGFDEARLRNSLTDGTEPVIYHIGSMDWLPNQQGVDWFVNEVMPELVKQSPHIHVRLAGKHMPDRYRHISTHLFVDGEVDDSIDYQKDKTIMIVPVQSGGGIRIKIIEAFALGKVIVTTTKGAEGITCEHGVHLLIADSPKQFASAILQCLESPELRAKLSSNGHDLYKTSYQLSLTTRKALDFYTEIL